MIVSRITCEWLSWLCQRRWKYLAYYEYHSMHLDAWESDLSTHSQYVLLDHVYYRNSCFYIFFLRLLWHNEVYPRNISQSKQFLHWVDLIMKSYFLDMRMLLHPWTQSACDCMHKSLTRSRHPNYNRAHKSHL